MKITDYGLWFRPYGHIPFYKKPPITCEIYFNGFRVGSSSLIASLRGGGVRGHVFSVDIKCLARIGFRIKPNSPKIMHDYLWDFPPSYVPSESDFEEIP